MIGSQFTDQEFDIYSIRDSEMNHSLKNHEGFSELLMTVFKKHLNEANNRNPTITDVTQNSPTEQAIIGGTTLFLAMTFFVINLLVLNALCHVKLMRNSFGYLNISLTIANLVVLLVFIVWYAPMIMLGGSAMDHSLVALKIVHFTGVCMCGAEHSLIFIAIGRYNALIHPLKYARLFSKRRTLIYIAISWATAFIHHFVSFFPQCYYYFDFRHYSWFHADSLCGEFLSWFVDLCYGFIMIIMIGGTDIATFYQLHKIGKLQEKEGLHEPSKHFTERYRKREWRFFVQAFVSGGIIMMVFLTFHLVRKSSELRLLHFLSGCVFVILAHGTNGVVLLVYNKEMRSYVLRFCKAGSKDDSQRTVSTSSAIHGDVMQKKISTVAFLKTDSCSSEKSDLSNDRRSTLVGRF